MATLAQEREYTQWANSAEGAFSSINFEQWLKGAAEVGPKIDTPPVLDFSEEQQRAPEAPEQGPVNAAAYARSQGRIYKPDVLESGARLEAEAEAFRNAPIEKVYGGPTRPEGWHDHPAQGPMRSNVSPTAAAAPQAQPYTPPTAAYGGLGAADSKEVWGASYGGMGEDPYLKSLKQFSQPFKQFFSQMQLDHF